jgi:class 3 adenylate cyclase/pSer/pThr/pTyr-binding forkhead associated (FHA) protein
MEQVPSNRLEELIRERARVDAELERCRELVTVLFVDIVGSTRFYDQYGDVAGLVMVQKCLELLLPPIEQHQGKVIKTIGDAILARFCEAEDAVRCAVEMQRNVAERNRGRASKDELHVRVAINVGLALLTGSDVFGDVVNVASRIESATEPDEVVISPSVYEKIQHLADIPIRKKASGVELKGKFERLDLYAVGWRPGEGAGPAPPRPSNEQLSIATGLHAGLAELAKQGGVGSVGGKARVVPTDSHGHNKTLVFGSAQIEKNASDRVRFMVACVCADGSLGRRYPLDHTGRIAGQQAEISLSEDAMVAPQHARFTQLGEGVYVEDLGSAQGVYLWLREPHRLRDTDTIQMGRQKLRFMVHVSDGPSTPNVSPDRTVAMTLNLAPSTHEASLIRLNSSDQETGRYTLQGVETSFGRSKGTYTFPDDLYMSTSHARIIIRGDKYLLEDLGSTNGTFVRIRKRALAHDGDTLMIGKQLLRVLAEPFAQSQD